MKNTPRTFPRRPGLSLIELMVSVAVVGVLATILFATLRGTMGSVQSTATVNRLRNCYMALQGYAAENSGAILPAFEVFPGYTGQRAAFGYRLVDGGHLEGPFEQERNLGCDEQIRRFSADTHYSFGMNGRIGEPQPGGNFTPLGARRFYEVERPERLALVMHGIWNGNAFNAAVYEARYAGEVQPVFGSNVLILFADGSVSAVAPGSVPIERVSEAGRAFWLGTR